MEVVVIDAIEHPVMRQSNGQLLQPAANNGTTGERLNMDFRDIDVREVIQAISLAAKQNILVDQGVNGTVTIQFNDVPWDEALNLIVREKGWVLRRKGNVFFIESKG